jgi:hypothetical protein
VLVFCCVLVLVLGFVLLFLYFIFGLALSCLAFLSLYSYRYLDFGGHIDIHSNGTILSSLILSTLGRDETTPRSGGLYMSRGKHECSLRLSFFFFLTTKSVESSFYRRFVFLLRRSFFVFLTTKSLESMF